MRTYVVVSMALAVLALVPAAAAQQPNTPLAKFIVNNNQGPNVSGSPWPILTTVPLNLPIPIQVVGSPMVPFLGLIGPYSPGFSSLFGDFLDLNATNISPTYQANAVYIWGNGFTNNAFWTDGSGSWLFNIAGTTPGFPVGSNITGQCIIADPSAPVGWSLTAACRITWSNPITQNLTLTGWGDDTAQTVNFLSFVFPFYNTNRTNVIVSANGYLCWNYSTDDFIPSTSAFLSAMPRCAAFWADLDPSLLGGSVTLSEQVTPLPRVIVSFNSVQGTTKGALPNGGNYSFSTTLYGNGDIEFTYALNFGAAQWPHIAGISPGGTATGAPIDISQVLATQGSFTGAVNAAIHEYWNPPPSPTFDLIGRTLTFNRIGSAPNFQYVLF